MRAFRPLSLRFLLSTSVGLSEREAHEKGLQYQVRKEMTSTWYSSRRVAEKYSCYKVLVEEGTDRILGAHLLGDQAGETINLFALAIRKKRSSSEDCIMNIDSNRLRREPDEVIAQRSHDKSIALPTPCI